MKRRDAKQSPADPLETWLEAQLKRPDSAPDLTRKVMGRLGYMAVPPDVAQRHRRLRHFARSGIVLAGFLAVGIGIFMHNSSPEARRPLEMTLPAAVGQDLESSQQRMGEMFRSLRRLTPSLELPAESHPDSFRRPNESPSQDDGTELMDDAINRSAIAPMRWV